MMKSSVFIKANKVNGNERNISGQTLSTTSLVKLLGVLNCADLFSVAYISELCIRSFRHIDAPRRILNIYLNHECKLAILQLPFFVI